MAPFLSPFGPLVVQSLSLGYRAPFLTVREIAAQLKVSTATVYKLVERGELPHVRVSNAVRIQSVDLARYLSRPSVGNADGIPSPEHDGGTS